MTMLTRITHSVNPPRQCERSEDFYGYSEDDMTALLLIWSVVAVLVVAILAVMDNCPALLGWIVNIGR